MGPTIPPPPPPDAGTNDDITRGLIAFFPFNGNANDESQNGKDGTITGATLTNDKVGNVDSAYLFNDTSDFIHLPVDINPSVLPEITMTAWARWDFMRIGSNPSFGAFFEGAIDQVRIYDRALSDSEIQLLMNQFNQ